MPRRESRGRGELDPSLGRWVMAGSVLGSGTVFLESTVVTVALPAIAREFHLGVAGLQWVLNGYLLPLGALMLLGGALGDRFRRSTVFASGLAGFAIASLCCAIAPTPGTLLAARVAQGTAGALLVPNSLAMIETTFEGEARGAAIGHWAGWSGISTALGPLLGGWLVQVASWRWVFASVAPFAIASAWIVWRRASGADSSSAALASSGERAPIDYAGAVLATLGLAGVVAALILGPGGVAPRALVAAAAVGGVACLGAFIVVEHGAPAPLLPLEVFRSRQFTGANVTTLLVYAALGGLFFLLMLELQNVLGYGPLAAGASLLPINFLMLALSPVVGRRAQHTGPRVPMTFGALIASVGMLLFTRVRPGASYASAVLPAVTVFGLGLAILVAPLTAAVLGAVDERLAGVASGVNNAVARLAGLLATAALPLLAGFGGLAEPRGPALSEGFARAMLIGAALCAAGAVVAWVTVSRAAAVTPVMHPSPQQGCVQRGR
ncbi:MAG TPA: MFS transporter [Gemmatimonadaceae bacterium]